MDENQIQEQLKKNAPEPYKTDLAPAPPVDSIDGQAREAVSYGIDELTLYKLHDYFEEKWIDADANSKKWIEFIYTNIAQDVGDTDYLNVLDRIRTLEGVAGIRHSGNRAYKLYQWLRLDQIRKRTEREMSTLGGDDVR